MAEKRTAEEAGLPVGDAVIKIPALSQQDISGAPQDNIGQGNQTFSAVDLSYPAFPFANFAPQVTQNVSQGGEKPKASQTSPGLHLPLQYPGPGLIPGVPNLGLLTAMMPGLFTNMLGAASGQPGVLPDPSALAPLFYPPLALVGLGNALQNPQQATALALQTQLSAAALQGGVMPGLAAALAHASPGKAVRGAFGIDPSQLKAQGRPAAKRKSAVPTVPLKALAPAPSGSGPSQPLLKTDFGLSSSPTDGDVGLGHDSLEGLDRSSPRTEHKLGLMDKKDEYTLIDITYVRKECGDLLALLRTYAKPKYWQSSPESQQLAKQEEFCREFLQPFFDACYTLVFLHHKEHEKVCSALAIVAQNVMKMMTLDAKAPIRDYFDNRIFQIGGKTLHNVISGGQPGGANGSTATSVTNAPQGDNVVIHQIPAVPVAQSGGPPSLIVASPAKSTQVDATGATGGASSPLSNITPSDFLNTSEPTTPMTTQAVLSQPSAAPTEMVLDQSMDQQQQQIGESPSLALAMTTAPGVSEDQLQILPPTTPMSAATPTVHTRVGGYKPSSAHHGTTATTALHQLRGVETAVFWIWRNVLRDAELTVLKKAPAKLNKLTERATSIDNRNMYQHATDTKGRKTVDFIILAQEPPMPAHSRPRRSRGHESDRGERLSGAGAGDSSGGEESGMAGGARPHHSFSAERKAYESKITDFKRHPTLDKFKFLIEHNMASPELGMDMINYLLNQQHKSLHAALAVNMLLHLNNVRQACEALDHFKGPRDGAHDRVCLRVAKLRMQEGGPEDIKWALGHADKQMKWALSVMVDRVMSKLQALGVVGALKKVPRIAQGEDDDALWDFGDKYLHELGEEFDDDVHGPGYYGYGSEKKRRTRGDEDEPDEFVLIESYRQWTHLTFLIESHPSASLEAKQQAAALRDRTRDHLVAEHENLLLAAPQLVRFWDWEFKNSARNVNLAAVCSFLEKIRDGTVLSTNRWMGCACESCTAQAPPPPPMQVPQPSAFLAEAEPQVGMDSNNQQESADSQPTVEPVILSAPEQPDQSQPLETSAPTASDEPMITS